jgi:DHA1 family tetracycline resistance protein-like MFS transporter
MSLSKIPAILPVALIYFLWASASQVYPASWSFFAQAQYGWGIKMVGFSLTVVGVSMAIVQMFVLGRVIKRFGERYAAIFSILIGTAGFLAVAFTTNAIAALLLTALMGLQGMAQPSLNAMMSRRTPANQQGELQGLNASMSALSFLIAQLLFNSILSFYTSNSAPSYFPGMTFLAAAAISAVALIALFLLPKAPPQKPG